MVEGLCFLTEEAEFADGGILYNAFHFHKTHYDHFTYYAKTESLEELLKGFKEEYGLKDIVYLPNAKRLKDFKSDCEITESAAFYNSESAELMQQLSHIEELEEIEINNSDKYKVSYRPDFLIYEIKSMAVKLPKIVEYSDGVTPVDFTFEYLIYPDFTVNRELLQVLRNATGDALPLNIENRVISFDSPTAQVYRPFSTVLHEFLYLSYLEQCNMSKGITGAIRLMEHDKVARDMFYDVYQVFRANKRDFIEYSGYTMAGPIQEMKFKEILASLNLTMIDISNINRDDSKREAFFKEHEKDRHYAPVLAYMRNVLGSPFNAMQEYKTMELERSYIRKMMYQLNMCWYDAFGATLDYINMVQPTANLTPASTFINNITGWRVNGVKWGVERTTYKPRRRK